MAPQKKQRIAICDTLDGSPFLSGPSWGQWPSFERHLSTRVDFIVPNSADNLLRIVTSHPLPDAVLVTHSTILESRHAVLRARLVSFARDHGGNVVFAGRFFVFAAGLSHASLDRHLREDWGLPWCVAGHIFATCKLSPDFHLAHSVDGASTPCVNGMKSSSATNSKRFDVMGSWIENAPVESRTLVSDVPNAPPGASPLVW